MWYRMASALRTTATSYNTVFVAHFVRPNWLTPTSQTPNSLYEIAVLKEVITYDDKEKI